MKLRGIFIAFVLLWGIYIAAGVVFGFDTGLSARDYRGCAITVSTACLAWVIIYAKGRIAILCKAVGIVLLVFNISAILLLKSRASFLAVIASCLYFLCRLYFSRSLKSLGRMTYFALIVIAGVILYFIRPDSADGRLLIWRVCLYMLADKPVSFLIGYGINGFSMQYMHYQAEFINMNQSCCLVPLADDVFTPYNEFLHLAITFGVLGLILVAAILLSVITAEEVYLEDLGLKGILLAFLVFCCFSFPLSSWPLCVLVITLIVIMRKKVMPKVINMFSVGLLVVVSACFSIENYCKNAINNHFISERTYSVSKYFPDIMRHLSVALSCDMSFDTESGPLNFRIMEDAASLVPSVRSYCLFADSLVSCGMYMEGCELYRKASEMVPSRLSPMVGLLSCQMEQGKTADAVCTAERILSTPVKVNSRRSIEIKSFARHVIDSLRHDQCIVDNMSNASDGQALGNYRALRRAVLRYYRGNVLKRKAAKYLLYNMKGHWSYEYESFKNYCDTLSSCLCREPLNEEIVAEANKLYNEFSSLKKVQDIDVISPQFVINNIEKAFYDWEKSPFLERLSFEDMCEYVLPYKVIDGQPCDLWRDYAQMPLLSGSQYLEDIDDFRLNPLAAAYAIDSIMNNSFKEKKAYLHSHLRLPLVSDYSFLSCVPYTTCFHSSILGLIAYRANGIPAVCDFTPSYSDRNDSHCWDVTIASNMLEKAFVPFENSLESEEMQYARYPKVYRRTFRVNPKFRRASDRLNGLPPSLELFSSDITDKYCRTSNVKIRVKGCKTGDWVFIAVPSRENWVPVDCSRTLFGKVKFKNIGLDATYIALSYNSMGRLTPVSDPFHLNGDARITKFIADGNILVDMTLRRKYPAFSHIWKIRHVLGDAVVTGSNYYHFEVADTLAVIPSSTLLSGSIQSQKPLKKYRYARIEALGPRPSCISEIYFYGELGKLQPVIVDEGICDPDSPEYYQSYAIEDNNALTFFRLEDKNHYIQYDFRDSSALKRISYIKRGDGNDVIPGDCYELYYWGKNGWQLVCRQVAEDTFIIAKDVPSGALYYLKDISRGVQNRVFSYESGRQVWR